MDHIIAVCTMYVGEHIEHFKEEDNNDNKKEGEGGNRGVGEGKG
jgi:hypothetical protein